MEKKQTAVEWLMEVYSTQGRILPSQFIIAREIEKERSDILSNLDPDCYFENNEKGYIRAYSKEILEKYHIDNFGKYNTEFYEEGDI